MKAEKNDFVEIEVFSSLLSGRRFAPAFLSRRGYSFIELIVAVVVLFLLMYGLLASVLAMNRLMAATRERFAAERLAQFGLSQIKQIPFQFLVPATRTSPRMLDSAMAGYGLSGSFNGGAYPYVAILDGFQMALEKAGFKRFNLEVEFLRRDKSDANHNSKNSELVPFVDNDNNGRDDIDPAVRFRDYVGGIDGDFLDWEETTSGFYRGQIQTEAPDTGVKRLTLTLWKKDQPLTSVTAVINQGLLYGDDNTKEKTPIKLVMQKPLQNTILYQAETSVQNSALALAIRKTYPPEIPRQRADAYQLLEVQGETEATAEVRFWVQPLSPDPDGTPYLASLTSNIYGQFVGQTTADFIEGNNRLWIRVEKDGFASPFGVVDLLMDSVPPVLHGETPADGAIVRTLAPFIGALLDDEVDSSTSVVSGPCLEVITLLVTGRTQANNYGDEPVLHSFNPKTKWVWWSGDGTPGRVPILKDNHDYRIEIEAGDRAGYKVKKSWNFRVSVPAIDATPPVFDAMSPMGTAASAQPMISVRVDDPESGIDPASIVMTVDGAAVTPSFDPASGEISYSPPQPFNSGSSHAVTVQATHWAQSPHEARVGNGGWTFEIP